MIKNSQATSLLHQGENMYSVPSPACYPTTVKDPQRTPATVSLRSFSCLPQTAGTDQKPHPVSPFLISWSMFNTPYKQPYGTTTSYLLQVGIKVEPIKRTIRHTVKPKPTQHLNSSSPGSCSICHIWNADWYKNQKPVASWDSGRISAEKKP